MWEQTSVSTEIAEPPALPLCSRCSRCPIPSMYMSVRNQVALLGIHPTVCFNFISSSLSIICDMPVRLYKLALWRAHRRCCLSRPPLRGEGRRRQAAGINAELVQSSHLNADKVTFIGCLSSCSFEHSLWPSALSALCPFPSLSGPSLGQCNDVPCISNLPCFQSWPGQGEWTRLTSCVRICK